MKRDDEPSRLVEHADQDAWIAGILRSTGPYTAPPGRKQRVLLGLGRSGPRRAPVLLRAAVVAAVLAGCGAFASAALGPWRGWIGRAYQRLVPRPAPAAAPALVAHVHRAPPPASPEVAPAPPVVSLPPPTAVPRAPRVHHAGAAPAPPAPPHAEQDTELVADGLRALRLDRDPPRARALLAAYLSRHPNGALAEEALALSIEAAIAHHDPDAAGLGARYLQRYPSGPFRALALRAQE